MNNFHEYLIQLSLKSGGTKDQFRQVKVPGTAPIEKACYKSRNCLKEGWNKYYYDKNRGRLYLESIPTRLYQARMFKVSHTSRPYE